MIKTTTTALTVLVVGLSLSVNANAQNRRSLPTRIREVKYRGMPAAAPQACLLAFRALFNYLQQSDANLVRDEAAQKRWLTPELRQALAKKVATFSSPADDPDFPSNATFVGSWDYPTTYSIVSSRRYRQRAIIDVLYQWGPKTNYPGDERTTSFVFAFAEGAWKLDDIYTFRGAFVQAESLGQYLREK